MISYYETIRGATFAIVLDEKGEVVSRQRVAFKRGPCLGGWTPVVRSEEPTVAPSGAAENGWTAA